MPWPTEHRPYRRDSLLTTVSLESPRRRKLPLHAKSPMANVIVQLNGARIIAPLPRRRMRRDMDDVGPPPQHYAKEENAQEADIDEHRRKRCKLGPCEVAIPPIKRRVVHNKKRVRPQSLTTRTRKAFLKQVHSIPVAFQHEYKLLGFPFVFPNTIPTGPVQQAVVEPPVVQIAPTMCQSSAEAMFAMTQDYPFTQQPSSIQPKTKRVVIDPLFNIDIPRSIVVATLVKKRLPLRVRKDARPLANAVPYRQSWKSKRPEHYKPVQRSVPLVIPSDLRERLAALRVMLDGAPTQEEPVHVGLGITVPEGDGMEVDDEDVEMYFTPSSSMDDIADEMEIWISPVKPVYHTQGSCNLADREADSLPRSAQDEDVAMNGGDEVWYDASDAGFPAPVPPANPPSSAPQSDLLAAAENFLASLDVHLTTLRAQRPSMPVRQHDTVRSVTPSPVRPTAALFAQLFSAFSTPSHKGFAQGAQGNSDHTVSPGLVTQTPLLDDVFGPSPALPQLVTPRNGQFIALTEEQKCNEFFMRGSNKDSGGSRGDFQRYRDVPVTFSDDDDR
ncbi:hypothetical protein C8Q74DRAFT_1366256 [Fomes fomentarius]|nr:hypothetical protein C8Q74DRAFT_1366256 [Fomes fomentarius]